MRILSIDTSTSAGSIVFSEGDRLAGEINIDSEVTHSVRLFQGIETILKGVGLTAAEIDAFAVICGPGSFTGVRIGLTTVKGLAGTLSKPTIPITAFEAWVEKFGEHPGVILPVIDARRSEVYAAAYRRSNGQLELLSPGVVENARVFVENIPYPEACFIGGGASRYRDLILAAGRPSWRVIEGDMFLSRPMARIACQRARAGQMVPAERLQAYYLRKSDAELKWKER
jgi:tRNA threonylcarbamoyladenosine biosynthesis protein TsaB